MPGLDDYPFHTLRHFKDRYFKVQLHPFEFGCGISWKNDYQNRTHYYTAVAELTLGPLSIPTQRFALDGEFRGFC